MTGLHFDPRGQKVKTAVFGKLTPCQNYQNSENICIGFLHTAVNLGVNFVFDPYPKLTGGVKKKGGQKPPLKRGVFDRTHFGTRPLARERKKR